MKKTFELTDNHIKLLRRSYIGWEHCEFGSPAIDCKRPYGNGDVLEDIKKIILPGLDNEAYELIGDKLDDWFVKLHKELEIALQIVLFMGKFETGIYVQEEEYDRRSWKKENENTKV